MSELLWSSWNAGTARAKTAIDKFSVTKHHVQRAGLFMNQWTDPKTGNSLAGSSPASNSGYGTSGGNSFVVGGSNFGANNAQFAQLFNVDTNGSTLPSTGFVLGSSNANTGLGIGGTYTVNQLPMFDNIAAVNNTSQQYTNGYGSLGSISGGTTTVGMASRINVRNALTPQLLYS